MTDIIRAMLACGSYAALIMVCIGVGFSGIAAAFALGAALGLALEVA